MVAQENEEVVHIRPACAECTHRCNLIHGDLEEEKFDPDRSWPHFRKKVTKKALHHSPQAALCIPGTFSEEYPNSVPKDKPITLEGPSGHQWKVEATDRSYMHSGWRAFAHDHHLREGDQLHFRLAKPSHFIVDIFNSHGDVRRSARKATVTGMYADPGITAPLMQGHSKKRKVDMAGLAGIGKSIMSNIVDRWNTPAKRGFTSFNEPAAKLRFSEETKQWESHEEKDGRKDQVVTIDLDSDDEKTPARSSKLGHFFGQVGKEKDVDFITPQSKAFAIQAGEDQKVVDAQSHQEITSDGEDAYVVQENEPSDEEEKQRPSDDPLRQFSNIFNTALQEDLLEDLQNTTKVTAEKAEFTGKVEKKIESASDPLSRKAQILCDEDMVMVKEEEDEDDSELDKTTPQACVTVERKLETIVPEQDTTPKEVEKKHEGLEADKATKRATFPRTGQHSGIRDNHPKAKVLESCKTPLAYKAAAADNELTEQLLTAHNAVDPSSVTLRQTIKEMSEMYERTENSKAADVNGKYNENPSPGQMQEEEGGFSFGLSPDNVFEYPVVINSIDGDQTDSKHPLKQGQKQAGDEETLKQMEDDEQDLLDSKTSYSIFEAHELYVTKTEPGTEKEENPNIPVLREKKETVFQSNIANPEFTTPEKEKNINIQARVASATDTCVLGSKRWQVLPTDRERALKEAQAWIRKIRNPNFMTVMKGSQVYTDFIMDVPADFAKHSNLPSHAVRVTLVCDEVPTNCKALWLSSQSQLDCRGWRNFSRSHCLEEGDVCVFECFPPATPTMASVRLGVYIFRVIKLTRPIVLDWTRHYKVLQGDNAIAETANGSPSPLPAQAHTLCGTNQAHEANSKEKRSAGLATL